MNDTAPVDTVTYILRNNDKYYCGKTNNMERRLKEHSKDKWKNYKLIWYICGDHEKKIKGSRLVSTIFKIFGVKRFYQCITTGVVS